MRDLRVACGNRAPHFNLLLYVDGLIKGFHDALKESDGSEEQALGLAQLLKDTMGYVDHWRNSKEGYETAFSHPGISQDQSVSHVDFGETVSPKWEKRLIDMFTMELGGEAESKTDHQQQPPRVVRRNQMVRRVLTFGSFFQHVFWGCLTDLRWEMAIRL